ncbi:MAG: shikimate kinase [Acidobacteriota bacterium]
MILKLKRTPGIYLVGFMGCGKSMVGRALADELGWRFVDLDEEIERTEGCSVAELFEQRGEAAFREIESTALKNYVRSVEGGRPHVVALGGGAFLQSKNFEMLEHNGVTIWLDAPLETVERRVAGLTHRPLARDPQKFRELFQARRPLYARADYTVHVKSDDPTDTLAQIRALSLV